MKNLPASSIGRNTIGAGRVAALLGLGAAVWLGSAAPAGAEVLYQNTGNVQNWGRVFTQKAGTITEVSSPVYKGTTAIKTTQTYQTSDGKNYHSEVIKTMAHLAGQDLYYGHAIYLAPDWVFHGQNVTFQQWAPEMPEAPWILMFLQGDKVRLGGRGANGDKDAGQVTGLRGTWIRIVTRIRMATNGTFEVWINGEKTFSQNGNFRAMGPSMRWSNGIYATRWDTETPTGPRELSIWHDNLRIATSYEEADPGSWSDGDAPALRADGGVADAGTAPAGDAGVAPEFDAGGAGGAGGGPDPEPGPAAGGSGGGPGPAPEGSGGSTGAAGAGGGGGPMPAGGDTAVRSGCHFGAGGRVGGVGWLALMVGLLLAGLRRDRRRR